MRKHALAKRDIVMVETSLLRHIEGFSKKRVAWLKNKISTENIWLVPLKIDDEHNLVMDGQHRMEVAKALALSYVPCIKYSYNEVEVWSLRANHVVTPQLIINKALCGDIYPYKTAKHSFPDSGDLLCEFELSELRK